MNKIQGFTIDTSEMASTEVIRGFSVRGTIGSSFIIQATKEGTIKYYDFTTNTFSDGHVGSANNLKVTLSSGTYKGNITFPSGNGTYNVNLVPLLGTTLNKGVSSTSGSIVKQADTFKITFQPFTSSGDNYATFPTSESTGGISDIDNLTFNWDITNAATDAGGFGLIPTGDWKDLNSFGDKLWFFTTTETVDGAISPTDKDKGFVLKVDDLTDIGVGSYISAVNSGSLTGNPIVIGINIDTKEIKLSIAQTFANGITLTFRADGAKAINLATGVSMAFKFKPTDPQVFTKTNLLTKTIRTGSSGTTVNLNGTYGVGHNDALTSVYGVGITTASVTSVTASSSAGSIVVGASQGTLTVGTKVYFSGIVQVFNVLGSISVSNYPSVAKTIYLDVDKFLTPATVS